MGKYQESKKVALSYFDALEKAEPEQVIQVFREYMTEDYNWKGVYPFREQNGREAVAEAFWNTSKKGSPLICRGDRISLSPVQMKSAVRNGL